MTSIPVAPGEAVEPDLHMQIMNLPVADKVKAELDGAPKGFYLLGHRDARHAAAELAASSIQSLREDAERLRELCERLKQEAQIHAQEADTQRATVHEIYQLCTGSTGEPGTWHGAEPVRAMVADAQRYRWLRNDSNCAPDNTPTVYSCRVIRSGHILSGENMDAAIDNARSAGK